MNVHKPYLICFYALAALPLVLVGWAVYDQKLSASAKDCFARGGSKYNSLTGCVRIEKLR